MIRTKDIVICVLLVISDVTAGVLGIEAQLAQNRQKRYAKVWIFECSEPSHEAYKLAMAAMMLLALSHVVTLILSGSICISSRVGFASSPRNKKIAVITLILSWILVLVAFLLLVMGAVSNARPQNACGLLQLHVLLIAAILCFFHGLFVVVYYLSATATAELDDTMMNPMGV